MTHLVSRLERANDREVEASLADVVVIIPALNEQRSLPLVLGDLPRVGLIILVDNGSTDSTGEVARQLGAHVIAEPQRGYGAACLRGLDELQALIASRAIAPRVVVFLDADYSDHPDLLPGLVAPILAGNADFVLGSRLLGKRERGAMPPQSLYGNRLACCLMWMIWGTNYTDLGPFRAISYESLHDLAMEDRNFGWTVEMQIKAAVAKLRTVEIPVPYRRRVGVSKISGTLLGTCRAGYKILFTIAKYAWKTRTRRRATSVTSCR